MSKHYRSLFLLGLAFSHAILLGYSATRHSPTINEPGHLLAGIVYWKYCDFDFFGVNPPLVRIFAAAPSIVAGYDYDWGRQRHGLRPEFEMGADFVRANQRRSLWLLTLGRWACIPFSICGLVVCYCWSGKLFGHSAGLLSATLWTFSPLVLGHASLIVPDAHAAALGAAAAFAHWNWLGAPNRANSFVVGILIGFATLAKTTTVLLFPIGFLVWIVFRIVSGTWRSQPLLREFSMMILASIVGICVLNVGYLCQGTLRAAGDYRFVSKSFGGNDACVDRRGNRLIGTMLERVPIPLPSAFVHGLDLQQKDFENIKRPSYMGGLFRDKGWFHYYAYAALVKTPACTLALICIAGSRLLFRSPSRMSLANHACLLIPIAIYFAVVSSKTGYSHHFRYVFPCIPYVFVWLGSVLESNRTVVDRAGVDRAGVDRAGVDGAVVEDATVGLGRFRMHPTGVISIALVFVSSATSLCHYPHSLSFFNAPSGGPNNGAEYLLDSNIDWGQDLLKLENWAESNAGNKNVYLAFFGSFHPSDFQHPLINSWPHMRKDEVEARPVEISDGYYAISINILYGMKWVLRREDRKRYLIDRRPIEQLRSTKPIASVGYSIRVFSAEQLRKAYRMNGQSRSLRPY